MGVIRGLFVASLVSVLASACGGSDQDDLFGSGGIAGSAGGGAGGGGSGGTSAAGGTAGDGGTSVTGGAGGATGGTGGATGGTGGVTGDENCTNGVDDNGDQLADCADPKCQAGYTCAPPAPSGWSGIGFVDKQVSQACPDGFQPAVPLYEKSTLVAPAAECGCACGTPNNVFCRALLACNSGGSCDNTTSSVPISSCTTIPTPNSDGKNSCRVAGLATTAGQCATQVKTNLPTVTWNASARACTQNVAGKCADPGQVCVQKLGGSVVGPCIAQAGDHSCPSGSAYSQKTVYFDGQTNDSRTCSASGCSCSSSTGGSCGCSSGGCGVQISWANNCASGGNLAFIPANGQCVSFDDSANQDTNWGAARVGVGLVNPGSCPASGTGTASGAVDPTGPVTVCCVP